MSTQTRTLKPKLVVGVHSRPTEYEAQCTINFARLLEPFATYCRILFLRPHCTQAPAVQTMCVCVRASLELERAYSELFIELAL